jgi:hypothetical protein
MTGAPTAQTSIEAGSPSLPVTSDLRDFAVRHHRGLQLVLAVGLYLAFAVYFTWPMITDPSRIYFGGIGDPVGGMANYRELVDHHHNPFLPGTISQFGAPEGQAIPWTRDLAALPSVLTNYVTTAVFGPVVANGIYILLAFVLTGTAMFLFVRRLVGNPWIALICGWAYAFYPFAVINAGGHADEAHGWVLVLLVWAMLELYWRPTRRRALMAGAAAAFAMWWTPYFILIAGVGYFVALVASLLMAWRSRRMRQMVRAQAVAGAIVVVFLTFLGALTLGPSSAALGVRTHSLVELNTFSARPLEYVIPDAKSLIFGGITRPYLQAHQHGSNASEDTLYLGVTVLVLALVAIVALVRRRLEPRLRAPVVLLAVIALGAFVTSAPPHGMVLGVNVPFPSDLIMKITTTWRVYSRFVILVMLCVTALAGIGLHVLCGGRRSSVRVAVMIAASVLIPLDLWKHRGITTTLRVPAVYTALAHQPHGLTAEYPLVPSVDSLYNDIYYQSVHGNRMINGYGSDTAAERRALTLVKLSDPSTAPRLASLGVRYVLLEPKPPLYGLPSPGVPGAGFARIYHGPSGSVYRVIASRTGPGVATASTGFGQTETEPDGSTLNWLEQPSGSIELAGTCRGCRGILGLTVASFARPRTVVISLNRRVLVRRVVTAPVRLEVPVTNAGIENLNISASPGPQSIAATIGGPDTRSVSVNIRALTYTWPAHTKGGG